MLARAKKLKFVSDLLYTRNRLSSVPTAKYKPLEESDKSEPNPLYVLIKGAYGAEIVLVESLNSGLILLTSTIKP